MQPSGTRKPAPGKAILLAAVLLSSPRLDAVELGRGSSGALEAVITEQALQVSGVTPGGEVAYLGAIHQEYRESWGSLETFVGVLTDTDGDGGVELAPKTGISVASVWIVVDLASGEVLGVSPSAFVKRLPDEAAVEVSSDRAFLFADRTDLELLLYRKGAGVWFGKGLDGADGDESLHADGKVRVRLDGFRSLQPGAPAAPSTVRTGDRLLAIDLVELDSTSITFQ